MRFSTLLNANLHPFIVPALFDLSTSGDMTNLRHNGNKIQLRQLSFIKHGDH